MAEIRLDVLGNTGAAQRELDALKIKIESLKTAIAGFNQSQVAGATGSNTVFGYMIAQLAQAEAQMARLQAASISSFSAIEGFSTRAIAAMRGQADAVKGVAKELTEVDRITRAGAGRVAYNLVDPVALRQAHEMSAAERRARQADIEASMQGVSTGTRGSGSLLIESRTGEQQAAQAVSEMRASMLGAAGAGATLSAGMREVGTGSAIASREARHVVGIFDEIKRGQYGAVFSSLGAGMRDAGLGATALYTGIGALVAVGVVEGLHRMAVNAGELAQKTQIAARAAGVSVEQYSRLSGVMQLAGGSTATLDRALEITSRQLEMALSNPLSRERGGFAAMGFNKAALEAGQTDLYGFVEQLRQKFQSLPDDGRRTEMFFAALGRSMRELQPYFATTSAQLKELSAAVGRSGAELSTEFAESLAKAGQKEHELDEAVQGLKNHLSALASDTGITDWLTREIEELSKAADGWRGLALAMKGAVTTLPGVSATTQTGLSTTMTSMPGLSALKQGTATATLGARTQMVAGDALMTNAQKEIAYNNFAGMMQPGIPGHQLQQFPTPEAGISAIGNQLDRYQSRGINTLGSMVSTWAPPSDNNDTQALITRASRITGLGATDVPNMQDPAMRQKMIEAFIRNERGGVLPPQAAGALYGTGAGQLAAGGVLGGIGQVVGGTGTTPAALGGLKTMVDDLQRQTKAIQDETEKQKAEFDKQVADAGHDRDKAAEIEKQKADFMAQQAQKTIQIQAEFRQKAAGAGFDATEIAKYADPTQSTVAGIQAQTQLTRATQEARDQQYQTARETADLEIAEAHRAAQATIESAKSSTGQKIQAEEQFKSQVSNIYSGLIAQSSTVFNQGAKEYQQLATARVNAEREADAEIARLRKQTIADLEKDAARARTSMQLDFKTEEITQRSRQLQMQEQGGGGLFTGGAQMYQSQVAAAQRAVQQIEQQAALEVSIQEKIKQDANAGADAIADAENKIKSIRVQAASDELQITEKLAAEYKTLSSSTTSFFNSLGSSFDTGMSGILKAALAPQVDIIHAGLTTIKTNERGQEIRQAIASMLLSAVDSAAKSVTSAAANAIGNMLLQGVAGKDLSTKLGNWLTGMFTGQAAPQASQLGTASLTQLGSGMQQLTVTMGTVQAATTTQTAATTLSNSALALNSTALTTNTAAQTTAGAANAGGGLVKFLSGLPILGSIMSVLGISTTANTVATVANTGATTIAATVDAIPKPFGFSGGGIVPGFALGGIVSAAGGMIVGGGGVPAILHPREMVLPAHISEAVQGMANSGGRGNNVNSVSHGPTNVNYSPTINTGRATISRSEFSSMLAGHLPSVVGDVRTMIRQGWRP